MTKVFLENLGWKTRNYSTSLLHIFCKLILNSKVIFNSTIGPDNSGLNNNVSPLHKVLDSNIALGK